MDPGRASPPRRDRSGAICALTLRSVTLRRGLFTWSPYASRVTGLDAFERLDSPSQLAAKSPLVEGPRRVLPAVGTRDRPAPRPSPPRSARAFPRGRAGAVRRPTSLPRTVDALSRRAGHPLVSMLPTRNRAPCLENPLFVAVGAVDAVTSRAPRHCAGSLARSHVKGAPKVVCIGPVTAREARDHGFIVHAVAKPHTIEGLIAALERVFTPRGSRSTDPA